MVKLSGNWVTHSILNSLLNWGKVSQQFSRICIDLCVLKCIKGQYFSIQLLIFIKAHQVPGIVLVILNTHYCRDFHTF